MGEIDNNSRIAAKNLNQIHLDVETNKPPTKLEQLVAKINRIIDNIASFGRLSISRGSEFFSDIIPARRPSTHSVHSKPLPVKEMTKSVAAEIKKNKEGATTLNHNEVTNESINAESIKEGADKLKEFVKEEVKNHLNSFNENIAIIKNNPIRMTFINESSAEEKALSHARKIGELLKNNPDLMTELQAENPNFQQQVNETEIFVAKETKVENDVKSFMDSVGKSFFFEMKKNQLTEFFRAVNNGDYVSASDLGRGLNPSSGIESYNFQNNPKNGLELAKLRFGVEALLFSQNVKNINEPNGLERAAKSFKNLEYILHGDVLNRLSPDQKNKIMDDHSTFNNDYNEYLSFAVPVAQQKQQKERKIESDVQNFMNSVDNSVYFGMKKGTLTDFFRAVNEKNYALANELYERLKPDGGVEDHYYLQNPKNSIELTKLLIEVEGELKQQQEEKQIESDVQNFMNSVGNSPYFIRREATLTQFFRAFNEHNYARAEELADLLDTPYGNDFRSFTLKDNLELTKLNLKVGVALFSLNVSNMNQTGGLESASKSLQKLKEILMRLPPDERGNVIENVPGFGEAYAEYNLFIERQDRIKLNNCSQALDDFAQVIKTLAEKSGKKERFLDFQNINSVTEALSINKNAQLQLHPDRNQNNPNAEELFKSLDNSYIELCRKLCKNLSIPYDDSQEAKNEIYKQGQDRFIALREKLGE